MKKYVFDNKYLDLIYCIYILFELANKIANIIAIKFTKIKDNPIGHICPIRL